MECPVFLAPAVRHKWGMKTTIALLTAALFGFSGIGLADTSGTDYSQTKTAPGVETETGTTLLWEWKLDEDESVSKEEFMRYSEARFAEYDLNEDGQITTNEIERLTASETNPIKAITEDLE